MFNLNKASRDFIQQNFIAVRNGFINEGLIDCLFDDVFAPEKFNNYEKLEKLYF